VAAKQYKNGGNLMKEKTKNSQNFYSMNPDWQNPEILHVNREKERSYFIPFQSEQAALNYQDSRGASSFFKLLNGDWAFKFF